MSNLLWQYYHNDEVERFRHLLQYGCQNTQYSSKGYAGGTGAHSVGSIVGSPSGFATSPRTNTKHRKVSGQPGNASGMKGSSTPLSRAELNSRDYAGLTTLHRACSSNSENAISFAMALLEHPAIDLYIQDTENGWTALHRALYFGNITLARAIIEKDTRDPSGQIGNTAQRAASSVIKVKDHEGNSPFDVYNATIARRSLHLSNEERGADDSSQDDAESVNDVLEGIASESTIDGDEVFAWGSSRNHGLGFKDQDDRQHPEKITLQRPDHLLFRFYREHLESTQAISDISNNKTFTPFPISIFELPTLVSNRPIIIQDVALSKLHSAILTTDPESNLFVCGFGPGGRLGTGDETTRFSYTCIEEGSLASKKIMTVALGQNHTLAVSSDGSVHSWGTNSHGQLGYTLPKPAMQDEEPVCATPRQIFGPLKREVIIGVAASAIHSVAHTSNSLFTWGKNEGQLGLMDSDSRSLEVQTTPRKVAASLFKAPINMVSAINGATVVLLANYTVCVFTNYGYNIVKFPLHEGFTNYHLKTSALTTRYDSISNHISHITAGGDTIAATSSRGDLFTFNVRKLDNQPRTSTTNPSKIRDSLSPPQRIWTLRKGNWDGIRSVGITENGSVLVCTQAGAVWQRVKRAKIKDTFLGASAFNRKDFKFQRIPGLTKVAAVRSTTFGVYAAVRKDCDVTRTQIEVGEQNLWNDVAPLLSIQHLEASKPVRGEDTKAPRFRHPTLPRDVFDPLKKAILMSPDPEADIGKHLMGQDVESYNIELCTTTSEVGIPVHSFILGRSPVFRKVLNDFRRIGTASISDILVAEEGPTMESGLMIKDNRSRVRIIFQGLDFMVIVNLAVYLYTDTVIDVWNFLRHSPSMSFRYRQVRVELMKIAGYLKLGNLESAVRLMTKPEKRMNVDFDMAIHDPDFFDNGDVIVELDDAEMLVHSNLLCRRCPFFDGLFNGRAAGQWLEGRRQESEIMRVDLKHVLSGTFKIVLRYLYADVGITLFDNVVSADIDEFSELVMDVMAVANELMLDRLSEICQQVIGRFVNTRNVCHLLNAVAPCSVTTFKDCALEYLCLQLESMLENHLLNDLDEDLLLELNEVVRANQLNCLPFAKSGRTELLLHERYPNLAEDILEERQRRVRDMTFRATLKDDDSRLSSSFRARVGSLDDLLSASPSQEKLRRKSKVARNAPFSPSIRPKDSTVDLMFEMDDEEPFSVGSPLSPELKPTLASVPVDSASPKISWQETEPRSVPDNQALSLPQEPLDPAVRNQDENPKTGTKMWSSPALPSSKLDMREIMAQASSARTSALSMSLSVQKSKEEMEGKQSAPKLSQKERKKQQQAMLQALNQAQPPQDGNERKPASPWQISGPGPKISLKDVLSEPKPPPLMLASNSFGCSPVQAQSLTPRRTASPDTRFAGQARRANNSTPKTQPSPSNGPSGPPTQIAPTKSSPTVPHSKSYTPSATRAEPTLQLSMSDIIGQQRREQEVIKEAVAKRSLQEIQEEQAFQEWWDQESRRAQEEEETARTRNVVSGSGSGGKNGGGRGKSGGRGRGGRGRGDARDRAQGRGQERPSNATQ